MSTSAPARVKTILVVDLTHVLNVPFSTTILGDLRARLIPPTRVGGPKDNLLKVHTRRPAPQRDREHHRPTTRSSCACVCRAPPSWRALLTEAPLSRFARSERGRAFIGKSLVVLRLGVVDRK
jgi:hypothetical protein